MRNRQLCFAASMALLLVLLPTVTTAQAPPCTVGFPDTEVLAGPTLDLDAPEPTTANLEEWVRVLTDPGLRGRLGGSAESAQVAVLLASQMRAYGLEGPLVEGGYCQLFPVWASGPDQNVLALQRTGSGERPIVVVVAHYDSLGVDLHDQPFAGANDNASGVAALMEVARIVALTDSEWPFDVLFVAFGHQMGGLVGSAAFVAAPPFPMEQLSLVIELDIVGRQMLDGMWTRRLLGDPVDTMGFAHSELRGDWVRNLVDSAAASQAIAVIGLSETVLELTGFCSDTNSFRGAVPTVTFSTGGSIDFHLTSDTPDRLDYGQIQRAAKLVLGVLAEHARSTSP